MEQIETKKAQLSATMGDQQIIQLFFQRCEEAITQTQKKYGALCRSVAQRLLADPRDTEECVSDTYLRVWNAIPPERPRSLRAYLARVTRNLALDRYNYNTAAQRSTALTDAFEELEPWIVTGQGDPDTELKIRGSFANPRGFGLFCGLRRFGGHICLIQSYLLKAIFAHRRNEMFDTTVSVKHSG